MEDYPFWALFGTLIGGVITILAFQWKMWIDSRKDTQALREEMHQMRIDLSEDIHAVGERVARIEGRLDEMQSWSRDEELVQ